MEQSEVKSKRLVLLPQHASSRNRFSSIKSKMMEDNCFLSSVMPWEFPLKPTVICFSSFPKQLPFPQACFCFLVWFNIRFKCSQIQEYPQSCPPGLCWHSILYMPSKSNLRSCWYFTMQSFLPCRIIYCFLLM